MLNHSNGELICANDEGIGSFHQAIPPADAVQRKQGFQCLGAVRWWLENDEEEEGVDLGHPGLCWLSE